MKNDKHYHIPNGDGFLILEVAIGGAVQVGDITIYLHETRGPKRVKLAFIGPKQIPIQRITPL